MGSTSNAVSYSMKNLFYKNISTLKNRWGGVEGVDFITSPLMTSIFVLMVLFSAVYFTFYRRVVVNGVAQWIKLWLNVYECFIFQNSDENCMKSPSVLKGRPLRDWKDDPDLVKHRWEILISSSGGGFKQLNYYIR